MLYQFVKILSKIVCIMPRYARVTLGNLVGEVCWLIIPQNRKNIAINNVRTCLDLEANHAYRLAKLSSTRFGRMFMEILAFPDIKKDVNKHVRIQGKEHLEEALSYGQGVVLATAHSGNWELLGGALALNGFPMVGVAKKQSNQQMDKFINEYRTLTGMHITYKTGVREMVRMLGEGKIIGLLMDQTAGNQSSLSEFFNRPTRIPQGPAALARMKNAPIVVAFITENQDGTHTIYLNKPIWIEATQNRNHDVEIMTQHLAQTIEKHIRSYPHEWFWLHNLWKNRPDK
ncbi:lysophospholipid acyltransferase family protein [Dendrosporobacter sp. 1207_IL3150]|uniref:lysophospholipid acyltransferase family protein n=1 Tax=Dendrosporobacter sp. 1207_IL3150 TaxID=3084054 RepID=UPI002FD8D37B